MLDKIKEWWNGIFLFEWNGHLRYAWVWKLLVSWDDGFTIGYYPDYEHCSWEWSWWAGEKR